MSVKELSGLDIVQGIVEGGQPVPFQDTLSITFTNAADGRLEGECELSPEKHGNGFNDNIHGGTLTAFADAIGGFAFVTTLEHAPRENETPFMATLTTNFRKPAKVNGGRLTGVAKIRDRSRSTGLVDVEIHQGENLVAQATGTVVLSRG